MKLLMYVRSCVCARACVCTYVHTYIHTYIHLIDAKACGGEPEEADIDTHKLTITCRTMDHETTRSRSSVVIAAHLALSRSLRLANLRRRGPIQNKTSELFNCAE